MKRERRIRRRLGSPIANIGCRWCPETRRKLNRRKSLGLNGQGKKRCYWGSGIIFYVIVPKISDLVNDHTLTEEVVDAGPKQVTFHADWPLIGRDAQRWWRRLLADSAV